MTIEDSLDVAALMNGEAVQALNEELQIVAANILDPSTKADATRKVKLEITIKPHQSREVCDVQVAVTSTIAPLKPQTTTFYVGTAGNKAILTEKDTRQVAMFDS